MLTHMLWAEKPRNRGMHLSFLSARWYCMVGRQQGRGWSSFCTYERTYAGKPGSGRSCQTLGPGSTGVKRRYAPAEATVAIGKRAVALPLHRQRSVSYSGTIKLALREKRYNSRFLVAA
jgi:hypothetical protein